jgi:hypothetical protein
MEGGTFDEKFWGKGMQFELEFASELHCSLLFRPKSGSMLLYSRKKVRYRRDGYCWKKRKDGKTTREDHMKLKVQGMEVSAETKTSAQVKVGEGS